MDQKMRGQSAGPFESLSTLNALKENERIM